MQANFSLRAQQDLEDIFSYGAINYGLEAAESYAAGITKTVYLIADQPHIARLRTEFYRPVRAHHWRNHYIIYVEQPLGILVIRVLHHSSDVAKHLTTDTE
jgi:toxin ParE1/3/4